MQLERLIEQNPGRITGNPDLISRPNPIMTSGMEATGQRNSRRKHTTTKSVLRPPDLEHAKTAVLNNLTSPGAQRGYRHAISEFVDWHCSEPRPAFNRIVVLRYRSHLEISSTGTGHSQSTPRCGAPTRVRSRGLRLAQRGLGRRYSPGQRRQQAGCTLGELAYGRTGPCPLAAAR